MPTPHIHTEVGREIDNTNRSPALKKTVVKDLEDHLPADRIPGQATQEPMKTSQREAQDDESPGS